MFIVLYIVIIYKKFYNQTIKFSYKIFLYKIFMYKVYPKGFPTGSIGDMVPSAKLTFT